MTASSPPPFTDPAFEGGAPLTPARRAELLVLLEMMGVTPLPPEHPQAPYLPYYHQALIHSSYSYETNTSGLHNNERLEFLGDAVLKLIISDVLYSRFPHYREGELTKIRAVVVSDATLAELAARLELGHYLIMGHNEARSGGARKSSNLACGLEALLGALYLDGRQEEARALMEALLEDIITEVDLSKTKANFKAVLQEYTQAENLGLPDYVTAKESGPSHRRTFEVQVLIQEEVVGIGTGKTKKEAQQAAARVALIALNQLPENE